MAKPKKETLIKKAQMYAMAFEAVAISKFPGSQSKMVTEVLEFLDTQHTKAAKLLEKNFPEPTPIAPKVEPNV